MLRDHSHKQNSTGRDSSSKKIVLYWGKTLSFLNKVASRNEVHALITHLCCMDFPRSHFTFKPRPLWKMICAFSFDLGCKHGS